LVSWYIQEFARRGKKPTARKIYTSSLCVRIVLFDLFLYLPVQFQSSYAHAMHM
jgi:hypothetical protein